MERLLVEAQSGRPSGRTGKKRWWITAEIVRKEACSLAVQHRYFSPSWFAEFKDYLHNGSPPFGDQLLKELCSILLGTEACNYCVARCRKECVMID